MYIYYEGKSWNVTRDEKTHPNSGQIKIFQEYERLQSLLTPVYYNARDDATHIKGNVAKTNDEKGRWLNTKYKAWYDQNIHQA